ncbi:MAG: bifunctional 4-hydroxy-2-oxoglutarate aldolase/2-dehydro-3-deoxy-phosphogluconate aldolase [Alphaproteobacteria bacterium]|nr:bifunctional 4-hydroxy-2-oxoglutarate aldolase/2-dehydro-3-deoxy-phosphogluconate aldolase [Alphaproteobacteria bacterium]
MRDALRRVVAVPVITAGDVASTTDLCKALAAGGLTVLEITLRTETALACVEAVAKALPEAIVGVGTALTSEDLVRAEGVGARFAVSPGFDPAMVGAARRGKVAWLPGAVTASEIMQARNAGFTTLKFFPAQQSGGTAALGAFAPVFGDVMFCPTGGLVQETAREYLACKNVVAVGGTWMMPKDAVAARDWKRIEGLARIAAGTSRG